MKTKNEKNKKFSLEKFEIAKLTNARSIVGGAGELSSDICSTDAGNISSQRCGFPAPPKNPFGFTTAP
jgi:hypothetical protein